MSSASPGVNQRGVDLRKELPPPAFGRPFEFEAIAHEHRGIDVLLERKAFNDLPARLSQLTERHEPAFETKGELFLRLSPSRCLHAFIDADLTLRNLPCSPIAVAPIRSAWMDEEHFQLAAHAPVEEDSGAPDQRAPRLRWRILLHPLFSRSPPGIARASLLCSQLCKCGIYVYRPLRFAPILLPLGMKEAENGYSECRQIAGEDRRAAVDAEENPSCISIAEAEDGCGPRAVPDGATCGSAEDRAPA